MPIMTVGQAERHAFHFHDSEGDKTTGTCTAVISTSHPTTGALQYVQDDGSISGSVDTFTLTHEGSGIWSFTTTPVAAQAERIITVRATHSLMSRVGSIIYYVQGVSTDDIDDGQPTLNFD